MAKFCRPCMEEHPSSSSSCPICGATLELAAPVVPPSIEDAQSAYVMQMAQGLGNDNVGQLETMALELALAASAQGGVESGHGGASKATVAQLQRFKIDDARCSILYEIVLDVHATDSTVSGRVFCEASLAAFSQLPTDLRPRPIVFGIPAFGDQPFTNAHQMEGAVVVLNRGQCSFVSKALRAQEAGASSVLILQSVDVWPFTMKDSVGEAKDLRIPVVMIRREDSARIKGLGDGAVGALRTKDLELQCPVCQDPYAVGSTAVRLPCRHVFHDPCLERWLSHRHTCPVCRFELPIEGTEHEATRHERGSDPAREAAYLAWFS